MPIGYLKRLTLTALALAMLAGCGSSKPAPSTRSSVPPATALTVTISGYTYHPARLTVTRGPRITFTNHDATAHTATSTTPAFDTGALSPGQSRTITLTKPGTYTFYCQFHAFMRAQVTVRN